MNKYDRKQAINVIVFLLISLACIKGCLSINYVDVILGSTEVDSLEN